MMSLRSPRKACCTSPAAIGYWFLVSLVSWFVIGFAGIYWHPLRLQSAPTILFALTVGCFANWLRNRTLHCVITAPIFLSVGLLSLLSELNVIRLPDPLLWFIVLFGAALAFFAEWRLSRESGVRSRE